MLHPISDSSEPLGEKVFISGTCYNRQQIDTLYFIQASLMFCLLITIYHSTQGAKYTRLCTGSQPHWNPGKHSIVGLVVLVYGQDFTVDTVYKSNHCSSMPADT
ncbi:uncharacterized protein LOC143440925 [Arvicanthis niloticus]|uniref:uncharacterized protein LOC143311035 n=1 Tax=Arvicanthis niloticus TaxID=61156 RepID=UPI00402B0E97